jgi:FlaA1/EpsC-like NDP-sugar epimerase
VGLHQCECVVAAIYTAEVIAPLARIDWRRFLDRAPLPQPSPRVLGAYAGVAALITGAAGSIGASLALRLARLPLSSLVLLDSNEAGLLQLQESWSANPHAQRDIAKFVLASAGDIAALEHIFQAYRPHIVFHAAAYKHVPLLEQQPFAAILNNIFVTETVTAMAAKHHARVLLLSTDKAVLPTSVMGATKSVAERIVSRIGGSVLRLGNVLATRGSVAEIFAEQTMHGGPLTVTAPGARRYFLTIDEAVDLMLAAAQIGCTAILAPDLRFDHSIAELASFIGNALAPGREISIQYSGLRPGEKLTERLWGDFESTCPANSGLLSISADRSEPLEFDGGLAALRGAVSERDLTATLAQLRTLVPGFIPSKALQALAEKGTQWARI